MTVNLSNEHSEQVAVINWARTNSYRCPVLAYLHAIPNGAKLPYKRDDRGRRFSPQAAKLLSEGLLPGVPDLFLPAPKAKYHGLYIEMKYGRNKPSPEQEDVIRMLRLCGYRVEVCYSADAAIRVIEEYLGLCS